MQIGKIYIDGKWFTPKREKFPTINPSNEKTLAYFPLCNEDDVELAINSAERGFERWRKIPAPERGKILLKIALLLKKNKERLAKLIATEMGKVMIEARADVQEAIDMAEYMAAEGRRLFGNTTPSELNNKWCLTIRVPLGIVAAITPWNFPFAIPAWKIFPALICGNSVIFKPSSYTPLCAYEFVRILEKAGIPKGVVNLITGKGSEVGMQLVKHKKIPCISFTGSRDTGKTITQNAGIKKIGLELGGKNPIIVMDDANLNLALDAIIWSAFGTTGQRCTACSRLIVHKAVHKKLVNALVKRARNLRIGNPLNKKTEMGPLVSKEALQKVEYYVNIGRNEGKLLCGGKRLSQKGFFYQATIFDDVDENATIAQEEIFGPVLSIIKVSSFEEAIDVANNSSYGLSSSIFTENIAYALKAAELLETGLTYINAGTIGSEVHLPFGGVKQTGHGREGGILGIDEFSEVKTIYIDFSKKLQRAQIDILEE